MPEPETTHPSRRSSLRRAVRLETDVLCDIWDTRVPLLATDLSDEGLWLQSQLPLEVGEQLIVSFRPPRWQGQEPITALAEVARVGMYRRRPDRASSGMGLRFVELDDTLSVALRESLRGLPPPLPGHGTDMPPALRLQGPLDAAPSNDVAPIDVSDHELQLMAEGRLHTLVAEGAMLTGGRRRLAAPESLMRPSPVVSSRHRQRLASRRRKPLRYREPMLRRRALQSRPLLRAV